MNSFKGHKVYLVFMLILGVFISSLPVYGGSVYTTPVDLGAAAPFAGFGGAAGVTNQGIITVVNGDLGTTGASALVTGFHDSGANSYTETPLNIGTVNGTIHTASAPSGSAPGVIAAAVALAAQNAFDNLSPAALPGGMDVSSLGGAAGQLGNRTLAPGIYKSAPGTFAIQGGDLTLDAGGNPNAVWVFQMATSLTVGGPGAAFPQSVLLVNGAQAKNVFWQVGSTATINAAGGGTMVGTIISSAATTFSTAGNVEAVTLDGRALALNASVTMVNTRINVPMQNQPVTVSSTIPVKGATGVPIDNKLAVTFSGVMDPATINRTTFTVKQGETAVSGTVTYSGVTAVFTPASYLAPNIPCTATITTGAKDLAGNALASNYTWSFTTGAAPDITKPVVSSTIPVNTATAVLIGNKLTVTFSEAMDPATINATTLTLKQGSSSVSGTVAYSGLTAVFTPVGDLAASTIYTATVTTGAKDLAGNAVATNYVWSFTTGVVLDIIKPTVTLVNPADLATGVPVIKTIDATFSEAMNPLTISTATFTLQQGANIVSGAVIYSGVTAHFTPTNALAANNVYTATITTGAKDLAGNVLARNYVWNFTTSAAATGPAPVNLGTAGNYVILAKTGVSTTGTTAVVGDIGVSPVAASYITGFSLIADSTNTFSTSSVVTGKLFAADYAPPTPANMTTAVSDMLTAFTDAAGRTTPDFTELGAGDISGLTLVPGLYKWGTGVSITNGVTLSGGANDVWIFQIAQDLLVNNSAIVTMTGGAQARNIFWQVSGKATLGTAADFKGIILSQTLISLNTGAKMTGRALAQTAVTLNATAITAP
jgi:Ice-binding-like/Bacterial Ig-like domain